MTTPDLLRALAAQAAADDHWEPRREPLDLESLAEVMRPWVRTRDLWLLSGGWTNAAVSANPMAFRREVASLVDRHIASAVIVVARKYATLDAAQPEPLDVERLARAMVAYTDAPTTNPDAAYGWGDDAAAFIAREYAALSEEPR